MDDDASLVDYVVLVILVALAFLVAWVIKLVYQLDQTKIEKFCSKGISVPLKANQIWNAIPNFPGKGLIKLAVGTSPPQDTEIKFKFNC